MPQIKPPKPLTLIVATTPIQPHPSSTSTSTHGTSTPTPTRLGIGQNGTLPWPRIKSDMSFFARVTSRPPPGSVPGCTNAIVMGRKTYDSVPGHLRPLGKRLSVVLSRSDGNGLGERVRGDLAVKLSKENQKEKEKEQEKEGKGVVTQGGNQGQGHTSAIISTSLPDALETLSQPTKEAGVPIPELGHIFIIGGAEIYASALELPATQPLRIVMTEVEKLDPAQGFTCDTFFPVDEELVAQRGWKRVTPREVSEWVGEEVDGEWKEEGDVRVRMVGYERT